MKTPWEILQLEPTNDKRLIKKAYAKLLRKYHPEEYPEKFLEIQQAYENVLQNTNTYSSSNEFIDEPYQEYNADKLDLTKDYPDISEGDKTTSDNTTINLELNEVYLNMGPNMDFHQALYYILNLNTCFEHLHQKDDTTTESETKHAQKDKNLTRKEIVYTKLVDQLTYLHDYYTVYKLLSSEDFQKLMTKKEYYKKFSTFLIHSLQKFDKQTLSLIKKVFIEVMDTNMYPYNSNSVAYHIENYARPKEKEPVEKKSPVVKVIVIFIFVQILIASIINTFYEIESSDPNDSYKSLETVVNDEKPAKKTLPIDYTNDAILEELTKEFYGEGYECKILNYEHESYLPIYFSCDSDTYVPFKGKANIGRDGEIYEIEKIDE